MNSAWIVADLPPGSPFTPVVRLLVAVNLIVLCFAAFTFFVSLFKLWIELSERRERRIRDQEFKLKIAEMFDKTSLLLTIVKQNVLLSKDHGERAAHAAEVVSTTTEEVTRKLDVNTMKLTEAVRHVPDKVVERLREEGPPSGTFPAPPFPSAGS